MFLKLKNKKKFIIFKDNMTSLICATITTVEKTEEIWNKGDLELFFTENVSPPDWILVSISVINPEGEEVSIGPMETTNTKTGFFDALKNVLTRIYNSDDPYTELKRAAEEYNLS